jgi:hypothetical protein
LKNCGWVAHRREFVCEEEKEHVDQWGHVWKSGDLNKPVSKTPPISIRSQVPPQSNAKGVSGNVRSGSARSSSSSSEKSKFTDLKASTGNSPTMAAATTKTTAASATKSSLQPPRSSKVPVLYGHTMLKNNEPRCSEREPLEPETFLQQLMERHHVQISLVDFMRTEVRYLGNFPRPCVKDVYYPCAPSLEISHAFEKCSVLENPI